MLPVLIACHLFALSFANPFHKYPFVFLLDVGNEELERINTEQIRVSVPGGSLALRYPAIGEGETVAHVRVSGIDFGTDLKANIVDGGPGYKYVVIVFMGNPGAPYDAVLTVQTVPNENLSKDIVNSNTNIEDDPNDSAEDLSDSENDSSQAYVDNTKAELLQSSSSDNTFVHESNDDYSETDPYISQKDTHSPYSSNSGEAGEVEDYEENNEDEDNLNVIPKEEECDEDNDDEDDDDSENSDRGLSKDTEEEQSAVFDEEDDPNFNEEHENIKEEYSAESAEYEDSEEVEQTFSDERYKDSNNNEYIDADDSSAVAY